MLKTPKLRFKDKNGNVYPEWEEKRIEEILKIKHGKAQKKIVLDNGKYPILATSGEIGRTNTFLWNKPSVLIGRKGTINKPQYMDTPFWTVDTLFYSDVFSNNNAKYIYYLFNTINWKKYDESTGVPSLSAKTIERIKVVVSKNLCEQEKIAGFLSKIDELINECESEVKDLEEQKKGLMQKIFSQQIRFKDSNNNPYPDWEEVQLNTFATLINGRAYKQNELLHTGKYPVLRVGNFFTNGDWYYSNLQLEPDKYAENGDLLYAWSASFGPRIWMGEKVIYHYHIWKISLKKNVDKLFLLYLLEQDVSALKVQMNGGIMMHITKENMENRKFILPCLEEQEKIAKVLSKMDELIEEKKALLSDWQQFKKGLLQQMFV